MLKKNILFLLLGVLSVATPAICMDPGKLVRNQAIDDEPVTIGLQDEQVKVEAKYAKLSVTLRYLIDDAGTDAALPIPNVTWAVWSKIQELLPHVFSMTSQDVDSQEKERLKAIILETIQTYDGATLTGFIAAVNYLDIPLLLELALQVAQSTGLEKITPEQIMTLPNEIRCSIVFCNATALLGIPIQICKGYTNQVTSVYISANDSAIVLGADDGTVRIWNRDGIQRALCKGHTDRVTSVCITQDGNTLVSGSKDRTVRIWSNDGTQRALCHGHTHGVNSVCISQDGNTIVSGSDDRTVRIWNKDGTQRAVCNGHTGSVYSVCISQDGNTIASGSDDRTVRTWNNDGTERAVFNEPKGGAVTAVCISGDGQTIVSRCHDKALCIWNADSGQRKIQVSKCSFRSMCFSRDGKTVVIGFSTGTMFMQDFSAKTRSKFITEHERNVTALLGNFNTIISVSKDGSVYIWDWPLAERLKTMNKKQALGVWVFLQKKLLPMLEIRIVKAHTSNCWRCINSIMEACTTKIEDTNIDGGEPVLKRHKSDD